jgi:predicted butyrate kinase (DUF1464 family)
MPRVVGIDPGTVSIDVCGLDEGRVVLDRAWPTAEALANADEFVSYVSSAGEPALIAGVSGYGLPLVRADQVTEEEWRLAFLGAPGEEGGIGGLRRLTRQLCAARLPVVFLPGVVHLDTLPAHRKLNRVDLGTADKVSVTALAVAEQAKRLDVDPRQTSFVLLELGGAFSAALAVAQGRIVDALGGTSGPIGWRAAGALDGEVAFLAGRIDKSLLFQGGVESVVAQRPDLEQVAFDGFVEGAVKAVHLMLLSAPSAGEIIISGRRAADPKVRSALETHLGGLAPLVDLRGVARFAKQGAQGAALIADGLAGGKHESLVEALRLRHSAGSVLDHLFVVSPEHARRRLGLGQGE